MVGRGFNAVGSGMDMSAVGRRQLGGAPTNQTQSKSV